MTEMENQHTVFKVRSLLLAGIVILAILALFSYSAHDGAVVELGVRELPSNWVGSLGAHFGYWVFHLIGLGGYVLALLTVLRAVRALLPGRGRPILFLAGEIVLLTGAVLLLGLAPQPFASLTAHLGIGRVEVPELALAGGVIGQVLTAPAVAEYQLPEGVLRALIGAVGTAVFGWILLCGGIIIVYFSDWHEFLKRVFCALPIDEALDHAVEGAQNGFYNKLDKIAEAVRNETQFQGDQSAEPGSGVNLPEPEPELEGEEEAEPENPPERKNFLTKAMEALSPRRRVEEPVELEGAEIPVAPAEPATPEAVAGPEVPAEPAAPVTTDAAERSSAGTFNADGQLDPAGAGSAPASAKSRIPEVSTREVAHGNKANPSVFLREYELPSINMLSKGTDIQGENRESIIKSRDILQSTLDSFKVPGTVSGYISGPRVTRYEISLEPGVRVSKVEDLADNIAMNLSAKSVRVLAPIPGRPVVGVETPNSKPEAVFMRSVMESDAWLNGKAEIPIVLGKDVAGNPVILDLAKAPHLLIAGSTGSGKSVCMNTLIMSLIFHFPPDKLNLIMVDPKIVEFEDYKHLPHLITPVINDSRKVPVALRWAVNEMEKRYQILACAGVKKLSEFNKRQIPDEVVLDHDGIPLPEKMPILIVIIDELADLMMTEAKKDAETSITRIAQKGRAAGVHIVVATQRPSTNVITGIIKANLPTRIAFRVGQMIDSRVILDQNGAETLLGSGDMLYMAPGGSDVERVQGAWVKDEDIKNVVRFVSDQAPQQFNSQVVAEETAEEDDEDIPPAPRSGQEERDDDFPEDDDFGMPDYAPLMKKYLHPEDPPRARAALEVVLTDRKISTSYLQRRLKIGYNQAAELIELFEERGIVGPASGSGNKREILILPELEGMGE